MKERILQAAAQEMNERGIKFTVDAVATRLGISKKTIYKYYSSKDELISCIVDAALTDLEMQEKSVMTETADFVAVLTHLVTAKPSFVERLNDWVLHDLRKFCPVEWQKIEKFRRERVNLISDILEEGIKGGHTRPIHTKVAAQMLLGAVNKFLEYRFLVNNNLTFDEALAALTDIFLYGVLKQEETNERI